MMCAGEFYEKSASEAIQFFDTIAENARTWETNTSVDTAKVHSVPQVPYVPMGSRVEEPCIICDDPTH